jgi:hypothetical protein
MYHDGDIDAAVDAGALRPSDAVALRRFIAKRHAAPPLPERDRHFRYGVEASSILPLIGLVILLAGLTMVSAGLLGRFGGLPVMAVAWWLAHRFAERREGLPMSLLFLVFALGASMSLLAIQGAFSSVTPMQGVMVAGGSAIACFAWWGSFRLPIAYMAGLLAMFTIGDHFVMGFLPNASQGFVTTWMVAVAVMVLAVAIWWDMSDIYRQTIRSDVAFWLHGLAGFELAASGARAIYGVASRPDMQGWASLWSPPALVTPGTALAGLVLSAVLALLALALDRRAYLFAGLFSIRAMMSPETLPVALLAGGAVCVALSAWWVPLRRTVLARLPATLRAQLPRGDAELPCERPVA